MRRKRSYTDEEKGTALAVVAATGDKEGRPNYTRAARLSGIPAKTLENWDKGTTGTTAAVANIGEHKKGKLADRFEEAAHALLDALPGKLQDATLQQVATALGIAVDKMRLLRGQSTADLTTGGKSLPQVVFYIPDNGRDQTRALPQPSAA